MLPLALTDWARRHHGVLTLDQARTAGFSPDAWRRAVRRGELIAIHRGVARLAAAPRSDVQLILAATLALPTSMASHTSGVRLWDVYVAGAVDPVHVTVERSRSARIAGVIVHRPVDAPTLRPCLRYGVWTTDPLRTLVDLQSSNPEIVRSCLEAFLVRRLVTLPAVEAAIARFGRSGRRAPTALVEAVAQLTTTADADSQLEIALGELLTRAGVPFVHHHLVHVDGRRFEIDFALPDEKIAIEVDGWQWHGTPDRFHRDRERDVLLQGDGWATLRFTHQQIHGREAWVTERVEAVRRSRSGAA
jgi:very-short-patch-repair endonuclease